MLKSMTAFARVEENHALGNISWELRSVNHRYLEVNFRLMEEVRAAEFELRKIIQDRLSRGKVDCTFRLRPTAETEIDLSINEKLVDSLLQQTKSLRAKVPELSPVNPMDVLSWPGVTEQTQIDQTELIKLVKQSFDKSIDALIANRQEEGERMQDLIAQRGDHLKELVQTVRIRRLEVLNAIRNKVMSRIEELQVEVDSNRLEQELVFITQKLDVDEELDRLESHLKELHTVINKDQPVGRRLDFLMQELNREANTLSSKSADIVTTQAAVDMKVNIEQMREQVQNIE
ncbi:MAG: YicC/YloC family endoribonuclease [Pseudomonadota bacterium]